MVFLGRNLDSSEDAGDYLLGFSPKRLFSIKNPGGVLVVSDQEKVKKRTHLGMIHYPPGDAQRNR